MDLTLLLLGDVKLSTFGSTNSDAADDSGFGFNLLDVLDCLVRIIECCWLDWNASTDAKRQMAAR